MLNMTDFSEWEIIKHWFIKECGHLECFDNQHSFKHIHTLIIAKISFVKLWNAEVLSPSRNIWRKKLNTQVKWESFKINWPPKILWIGSNNWVAEHFKRQHSVLAHLVKLEGKFLLNGMIDLAANKNCTVSSPILS